METGSKKSKGFGVYFKPCISLKDRSLALQETTCANTANVNNKLFELNCIISLLHRTCKKLPETKLNAINPRPVAEFVHSSPSDMSI